MGQKKHYINIYGELEEYVRPHLPLKNQSWQLTLLEDILHRGDCIQYLQLRPNHVGPQIGILGKTLFYKACQDHTHSDTLFIFGTTPLHQHQLQSIPLNYEAKFLFRDRHSLNILKLDSVRDLMTGQHRIQRLNRSTSLGLRFHSSNSMRIRQPSNTTKQAPTRQGLVMPNQPQPTLTLKKLLGQIPEAQLESWRPGDNLISADLDDDTLVQLRRIWRTYHLERYFSRLNRKTKGILERHGISSHMLEASQKTSIWQAFGTKMLNKFAQAHQSEPQRLGALLEDLGKLSIPDDIRVLIWTGRLEVLSPVEMRRELSVVVESLAQLEDGTQLWERPLLNVLERFATAQQDDSVFEVLEEAREHNTPLLMIVAWVRDLVMEEPVPQDKAPKPIKEAKSAPIEQAPAPSPVPVKAPPAKEAPAKTESREPPSQARTQDEPVVLGEDEATYDAWLMSLISPGDDTLQQISQEFEASLERILDCLGELNGAQAIFDLQHQITILQHDAERWSQTLPRREDTSKVEGEARQAFLAGHKLLGSRLGEVLVESDGFVPEPEELLEILHWLEDVPLLARLPTWLWPEQDTDQPIECAKRLCSASVRLCARAIKRNRQELESGGWEGLKSLPAPTGAQDALDVIENYIEQHRRRAQFLQNASPAQLPWITLALQKGHQSHRAIEAAKDRLEHLKEQVDEQIFQHICDKIEANIDKVDAQIDLCIRCTDKISQLLGSAKNISLSQFDTSMKRVVAERNVSRPTRKEETAPPLKLERVKVDFPHRSVSMVVRDYEPPRPYSYVRIPVYLSSSKPQSVQARVEFELSNQLRKGWPSNWASPTPGTLDVSQDQWHAFEDRYRHELVLEIPIRRPQKSEIMSLKLTLLDVEGGDKLAVSERYRWPDMVLDAPQLKVVWPDRLNPDYVLTQPIGPQLSLKKIKARCQEGGSFAALAPRRFGKSTLVAYLEGQSKSLNLVIPRPAVLTEFHDGSTLDYADVWEHFSNELSQQLNGVTLQNHRQELPSEDAFDNVRKQAKNKKFDGILLLIDEAQLFFPRVGGERLGDRLKGFIERHWANTQTKDMVPILFGFVGLPSFHERGGANLMGLLRPELGKSMDDDTLNRLLRDVTESHFHTTGLARNMLAKVSGNLFILRTLLDRLVDHCRRERKHWATAQDVHEVTENLRNDLRHGDAKTIESYIRDIVNSAESVNAWKPRQSLPIALALAHLQRDGEISQVRMEKAIQTTLNEWCESVLTQESGRLTYPIERVTELVEELRDNQILQGWKFRSPLLEAWLQGKVIDGYPTDLPTQKALSMGAIPRLRLSTLVMEKVSEGRQAQVFRYTDEKDRGVRWAVRKSRLDDDTRGRFLESLKTLHILRHDNLGREEAAQYIFELRDMGLSEEDDSMAVQIYRWIDGFHLGEKRGQLPVPLVVDIGWKLASAVHLLHRHNILHRDIRPENIILSDDKSRPTLIDFGLARSDQHDMRTRLYNEEAPQEVQKSKPHWTSAADVFMLASSLKQLAMPRHPLSRELMELLAPAMVNEPTQRISAQDLAEKLEQQAERFNVRDKRDQIHTRILQLTRNDDRHSWYTRIVRKFMPRFQDLGLGLHDDIFERGCDVADFLNQVLEAYPDSPADRLSLGYVKHTNAAFGDKLVRDDINLLHKMRTYRSHAATRRHDNRRDILRGLNPQQTQTNIINGTQAIEQCLNLRSLSELVGKAIEGSY